MRPILPFITGPGFRLWPKRLARLMRAVNALMNMEVRGGTVIWSDSNVVIIPPESTATSTPENQFKGQWVQQVYNDNDIVIRDTTAERDAGLYAGTWIAKQAVPIDALPPGEDADVYWERFARGAWNKLTVGPGAITLNDDGTGTVDISTAAINGRAVSFRSYNYCVLEGTTYSTKTVILLGTEPF